MGRRVRVLVRLLLTAGLVACSAALLRVLEVRGFGWGAGVLVVMLVVQVFTFGMIQLARRRRGLSDATRRPDDG